MSARTNQRRVKKRGESLDSLKERLRRAMERKDGELVNEIVEKLIKGGCFECPEIRNALLFSRGERR